MYKAIELFEKLAYPASRLFNRAAGIMVLILMFFTFSTVILRYLFNSPILGDFELIVFLLVVLVAFALPYSMVKGKQVAVTFFSLPKRTQALCNSITSLFSLIIFSLAAWQSMAYGNKLLHSGQTSAILHLSVTPFLYAMSFSFILLSLVLVVKILHFITEVWMN